MVLYLQSTGHPEALVWVQTQCRHHAEMLTGDCTLQAAPLQGHPSCAALHGVPLPGMLCAEGAVLSPVAMQLLRGDLSQGLCFSICPSSSALRFTGEHHLAEHRQHQPMSSSCKDQIVC